MKKVMFAALLISLAMVSCRSVDQSFSGEEETVLEIRNQGQAELRSALLPGTRIFGEIEKEEDAILMTILKVDFFGNWENGWTHGSYEASGRLRLRKSGNSYGVEVEDPVSLWEIEEGEIRYYDTYYRKDQGLHKVRQRVDRITEIASFLQEERGFSSLVGNLKKETPLGPSFQNLQGRFLYPEFFDRGNTGIGYWQRGNNWDEAYSAEHFPEHLIHIRNSGTMWRDYEEAPQIFMSLYNMQSFFASYIQTVNLKE